MLVALIVLSSLATLGTLTTVSVQASLKASTNDRAQTVALYAAESGGAMAIEVLRNRFDPSDGWGAFVDQYSNPKRIPVGLLPANGAQPGDANNPFSADQKAWFEVDVMNNHDDAWKTGAAGVDSDARVIVRATGHGPQGSLAILEWEIQRMSAPNRDSDGNPTTVPVKGKLPVPVVWDWFDPGNAIRADHPIMILSWRTVL
jgi:hypothetical protein